MHRLILILSIAALCVGILAPSPAGAGEPPTAASIAQLHADHGHEQWRHGEGTPGHRWSDYQREARQLRAYLVAVARGRFTSCAREPHCAVKLASYLLRAPGALVARVVGCESTWNPSAANPRSSAGGLFQFLASTWASLAGRWGMSGRSRFEIWPSAVVGAGTIAEGGIEHWNASRGCWA